MRFLACRVAALTLHHLLVLIRGQADVQIELLIRRGFEVVCHGGKGWGDRRSAVPALSVHRLREALRRLCDRSLSGDAEAIQQRNAVVDRVAFVFDDEL